MTYSSLTPEHRQWLIGQRDALIEEFVRHLKADLIDHHQCATWMAKIDLVNSILSGRILDREADA